MNVFEVKVRVPIAGQNIKERQGSEFQLQARRSKKGRGQTFARREARSKADVKYTVKR
jgi:hypothetical protein